LFNQGSFRVFSEDFGLILKTFRDVPAEDTLRSNARYEAKAVNSGADDSRQETRKGTVIDEEENTGND
jgi:hypothetical protein